MNYISQTTRLFFPRFLPAAVAPPHCALTDFVPARLAPVTFALAPLALATWASGCTPDLVLNTGGSPVAAAIRPDTRLGTGSTSVRLRLFGRFSLGPAAEEIVGMGEGGQGTSGVEAAAASAGVVVVAGRAAAVAGAGSAAAVGAEPSTRAIAGAEVAVVVGADGVTVLAATGAAGSGMAEVSSAAGEAMTPRESGASPAWVEVGGSEAGLAVVLATITNVCIRI